MMKSYRVSVFAVFCVLFGLAGAVNLARAGDNFIAGIEDLPLVPGLSEITEAGLVFDKPSGRIVEAFAEGEVTRQTVESFYVSTLPQLGWLAGPDLSFQRDGEQLRIEVREEASGVTVQYTLSPQ